MMNLPSEITICEVGLRDGLQNEKTIVSTEDKLSLLRDLVDAGFPVIELLHAPQKGAPDGRYG